MILKYIFLSIFILNNFLALTGLCDEKIVLKSLKGLKSTTVENWSNTISGLGELNSIGLKIDTDGELRPADGSFVKDSTKTTPEGTVVTFIDKSDVSGDPHKVSYTIKNGKLSKLIICRGGTQSSPFKPRGDRGCSRLEFGDNEQVTATTVTACAGPELSCISASKQSCDDAINSVPAFKLMGNVDLSVKVAAFSKKIQECSDTMDVVDRIMNHASSQSQIDRLAKDAEQLGMNREVAPRLEFVGSKCFWPSRGTAFVEGLDAADYCKIKQVPIKPFQPLANAKDIVSKVKGLLDFAQACKLVSTPVTDVNWSGKPYVGGTTAPGATTNVEM